MRRSNAVLEASMPPQRKAARRELCRHIPSVIAAAMVAKGVTATEIAARLGTTLANVSQTVNGERNLTLRTLADFAWALGMEPEELFASAEIARLTRELEEARERERGYRGGLERIIGLTFDSPIAPPGGPDPHADDLYNRVVRVNRAARRALAATPPQEASPVSTGGKADGAARNARRDAEFVRGEMEASEPKPEPRCKYGYKLGGCELGHPVCACADDMLAGELEAMEP